MQAVEDRATEREQVAEAHREARAEAHEPNADDAHERGDDVEDMRPTSGYAPGEKRHHDAVRARQKRVLARRRVRDANGLQIIAHEEQEAEERSEGNVILTKIEFALLEVHQRKDERRQTKAHDENPCRRDGVGRILDNDERATPNQGSQDDEKLVEHH